MVDDPDALVELRDVIGRMATPTIIIGDEILLGFAFNRRRIEELIGELGLGEEAPPSPAETPEEERDRQQVEHEMVEILKNARTIAIVGLSPNPDRPSRHAGAYLQEQGYRVIPVNPTVDEVLGEKSYPDLASVPYPIDVVDIFRRPEYVPEIVEAAIEKGVSAVWMQLGIRHEEAAERARSAGLQVIMDRCIHLEHARLSQEGVL